MSDKPKRISFSDKKLVELPLDNFISSIDYSWKLKWNKYNYSNKEKTFLIIKNLGRALEYRSDIVRPVYEKLVSLNNEEDVKAELKIFFEANYGLKNN